MTKIEWTDDTWNPIAGCSRVSEGCRNCYAERLAARDLPGFEGLAHFVDRPDGDREARWTGAVMVREHLMDQPSHWRRPRRIFVNSMSDLFHDAVPDEVIDRIFGIMAGESRHTFQILTKRPERMRRYIARWQSCGERMGWHTPGGSKPTSYGGGAVHVIPSDRWPLPNVWLGVSVEDQITARVRISYLLETPAAVRFVSAEPLLGPIDFRNVGFWVDKLDALTGEWEDDDDDTGSSTSWGRKPKIDGIFVGGESGPRARPMHPDWARFIRDQCAATGTPFLFKQWGEYMSVVDRDRDDPDWRLDYSREYADVKPHRWLNIKGGRGFHGERFHVMRRVGKRAGGRLLDGIEHNSMPEVAHG